MRAVVVIPTYNERENLPEAIRRLAALDIDGLSILVVDDNSPDGTGDVAEKLAAQYPVRVLHREKKEGIGPAYIAGFHFALAENPDCVFEMDADLSHEPEDIPQFLQKLAECDLVLGSRYTAGGRIEKWGALRRMVSRLGNWYARTILDVPYRDLTGGFKCYRREVLRQIDWEAVSSLGYNFQIETTYRAHQKKFRICEIPITFTERKQGTSKFNLAIMLESFWKVFLLRLRRKAYR